jgi:hypothetical protein
VFLIVMAVLRSTSHSSRYRPPTYTPPPRFEMPKVEPAWRPPPMPAPDFRKLREDLDRLRIPAQDLNGASHLLEADDVPFPPGLCFRIRQEFRSGAMTPGRRVCSLLGNDSPEVALIEGLADKDEVTPEERKQLLEALNKVLDRPDFYDERHFRGEAIPLAVAELLAKRDLHVLLGEQWPQAEARKANRLLLQAVYPKQVTPREQRPLTEDQRKTLRDRAVQDREQARLPVGPELPPEPVRPPQ